MKYKKTIITALTSLLATTSAVAGGGNVGNGGMAYVCYGATRPDGTRVIRSAELVDYWEARQGAYRMTIDLGVDLPGLDDTEKMKANALKRLSRIDSERANEYARRIPLFKSNSRLMKGALIEKTLDANLILRPKDPSCEITQLVYQVKDPKPMQVKFLIDEEIYSTLSDTDKAGIELHEVIYWSEIERGATTSDGTRDIVRLISSVEIENLEPTLATHYLRSYTLVPTTVLLGGQKVSIHSISPQKDGSYLAEINTPTLNTMAVGYANSSLDVTCNQTVTFSPKDQKTICRGGIIHLNSGLAIQTMEWIVLGSKLTQIKGQIIIADNPAIFYLATNRGVKIETFKHSAITLNSDAELLEFTAPYIIQSEKLYVNPQGPAITKIQTKFGKIELKSAPAIHVSKDGNSIRFNYWNDDSEYRGFQAAYEGYRLSRTSPAEFVTLFQNHKETVELFRLLKSPKYFVVAFTVRMDGSIENIAIVTSASRNQKIDAFGGTIQIRGVKYVGELQATVIQLNSNGQLTSVAHPDWSGDHYHFQGL